MLFNSNIVHYKCEQNVYKTLKWQKILNKERKKLPALQQRQCAFVQVALKTAQKIVKFFFVFLKKLLQFKIIYDKIYRLDMR